MRNKPIEAEVKKTSYDEIVAEIEIISEGVKKLLSSRLTERAIILLIQDACPTQGYGYTRPGKPMIRDVLNAAANLKEVYLKKLKAAEK